MATYRVFLRRHTVPDPDTWDWSETVVAPTTDIAVGMAYENWRHSDPSVPPLSLCDPMVRPVGHTNALAKESMISPAQQEYINAIQKQVSQALESRLDGAFQVVSYPAGFNYGITYGANAWYNEATLHDIDALLGVSDRGELCLTGQSFSAFYHRLLQSVTFSFSQQNLKTMSDQDAAASAQVASVVTEFENAGGEIPSRPGFGGKLGFVFKTLTDAYGSLDNLPDSLNALRNAILTYKALAAESYALHSRRIKATARLQAALKNTTDPAPCNGGQQVGRDKFHVGYNPAKLPTANQLIGSLSNEKNAVKVSIALSNFSSETADTRIAGGASFKVPLPLLIRVSVNSSSSYTLSRYTSSSSTVEMDITYPGITLFSAMPSELSADNTSGWYANDILQGVAANTGKDATGYKLQGDEFKVKELFGRGGVFSRLKTFVISQQPTITLTFTNIDVAKLASDFRVKSSVRLNLFGLFSIGMEDSSYQVQKVDTDSQSSKVTVTFGSPEISGTIPLEKQTAFVLGGVASYPPDHI